MLASKDFRKEVRGVREVTPVAESKMLQKSSKLSVVYNAPDVYVNNIGSTIQTSYNLRRYSWLELMFFEGSISGSARRMVLINNWHRNMNAYFLFAIPTGYASVRVSLSDDSIEIMSSTQSSLFLSAVYAYE